MSQDHTDRLPRDRETNPSWMRLVWWPLSVLLTFCMVTLSLICIDEYFLNHRLVLRPLQTYAPDLIDPLCQLCMAIYLPVSYVLRALQIVVPLQTS